MADQIGKSNAALIELMKIIGERNIQITPRFFFGGGPTPARSGTDAVSSVLVGTMLDRMVSDEDDKPAPKPEPKH